MNVNVPAATGQDANITEKQLPTHLTEAHISHLNQEMHETFVPTVWDSLSLHFFSYPVPSFVNLNYIIMFCGLFLDEQSLFLSVSTE